jgi:hypothetical protein
MKRIVIYITSLMLIAAPVLLQAMPVPSMQSSVRERTTAYSGGNPPSEIATRVLIVTLLAGITIAGVVKLTDDNPDNNWLGLILISPVIMEGILYLILDENETETVNKKTTPGKTHE